MNREQIIETMARGMCASEGTSQCAAICLTRFASSNRKGQCADACRVWGRKATAALSALEAAGLVVVPVELTPKMDEVCCDTMAGGLIVDGDFVEFDTNAPQKTWSAMIKAAQVKL